MERGIFGIAAAALRCESGESCLVRDCPGEGRGPRPGCGMPRLVAMSRARDGDESRTELPSLDEAMVDADDLGLLEGRFSDGVVVVSAVEVADRGSLGTAASLDDSS